MTVLVTAPDRRGDRRAQTRAEIVAAAWELARERGLAGLSMRDLGERVGMRAQSVYSYFASKDEIYDAMFRQGWEEYVAALGAPSRRSGGDPRRSVHVMARRFFAFATADPVRHQLLFQRTLPGFEPSADSYAVAVAALERMHDDLRALGVVDPDAGDLVTAVLGGLVAQQLANDPGGRRWERLVDRAVDMLLAELLPDGAGTARPRRRSR